MSILTGHDKAMWQGVTPQQHTWSSMTKSHSDSQIVDVRYFSQQDDQPSCCCLLTPRPKIYLTDGWLPYRGLHTCLHELYIGTYATEYAKHFRTGQLWGPAVTYFMLSWKGDSKKKILHFISADKDSSWCFSLLILHLIPSPRCEDFGTSSREMMFNYKAEYYVQLKCLPQRYFALTLGKWNGWFVFYFMKVLYTFAKVFLNGSWTLL